MKFIKVSGDCPVITIKIENPEKCHGINYYYPDGITFGFWRWKKTYYLEEVIHSVLGKNSNFFKSTDELLNKLGRVDYMVINKVIYHKGYIILDFGDSRTSKFTFRDTKELKEYLDNLESKYSIPLSSYLCLDNKNVESLYEYKEKLH